MAEPGNAHTPPPDTAVQATTPVQAAAPPVIVSTAPSMPLWWRLAIGGGIVLLGLCAYLSRDLIGVRGQSVIGVLFFFGLIAAFSSNLRLVNWRTIAWGFGLQVALAILVLKVDFVFEAIRRCGDVMK